MRRGRSKAAGRSLGAVGLILIVIAWFSHEGPTGERPGECQDASAHFNFAPLRLRHHHFEYARFEASSHTFGIDAVRKVEDTLVPPFWRCGSHHQPPLTYLDLKLFWFGVRQGELDAVVVFIFDH